MDVLSVSLERVEFTTLGPAVVQLSSPWGIRFGAISLTDHRSILGGELASQPVCVTTFHSLIAGHCALEIEGRDGSIPLNTYDLAFITRPVSHSLRVGSPASVYAIEELIPFQPRPPFRPSALKVGDGELDSSLLGGLLLFPDVSSQHLLRALPQLIVLRSEEHRDWLPDLLRLIAHEAQRFCEGSATIINHLVQVLFCQIVRRSVSRDVHAACRNWLSASLDKEVGPVLVAMHERMDDPWTVESAAAEVAMSRSSFARRFTDLVGMPPLQYLTQFRMQQARKMLETSAESIKQISRRVGYESEAAFSTAFRRHFKVSPSSLRSASKHNPATIA